MSSTQNNGHTTLTLAGLLIALGIIYGDIGTSPLYVMKAIIGNRIISEELVLGGLSCVIWTLTLQTTLKYVILTLRADNNGEGGIFSLYSLIKRRVKKAKWIVFPAMIGGCTLLADGIITPSISISSAVEGLEVLNPHIPTFWIVIAILIGLFSVQQFGTALIGKAFGPLMLLWFGMLGILGINQIINDPTIFKAINPYYAYNLLIQYPHGFGLLGAVFLCTTGAEALYSDLGHCGRDNIRYSWIFVKTTLILNYLGQGVWLLSQKGGYLKDINPFFGMMPSWFLIFGIIIATIAAVIASQALISGSFTLISEALTLYLWPKSRIFYPSDIKGQVYIPSINWFLLCGCILIMFYFERSANMEAAYGLAITLTMMSTTYLLYNYLYLWRYNRILVYGVLIIYGIIESCFLLANIEKFPEGGWISLAISSTLFLLMFIWYSSSKIRRSDKFKDEINFANNIEALKALSQDETVPKYATNLVYLTSSKFDKNLSTFVIEDKIIYSIFQRQPKRADIYWFINVQTTGDPYTMDYKVDIIADDDIIWVEFRLGFRVQPRINILFRKVVEDLVQSKQFSPLSRYPSLAKFNKFADFRFIILRRYLAESYGLSLFESLILQSYFFIKSFTISDGHYYGLQTGSAVIESVPLTHQYTLQKVNLVRVYD